MSKNGRDPSLKQMSVAMTRMTEEMATLHILMLEIQRRLGKYDGSQRAIPVKVQDHPHAKQ